MKRNHVMSGRDLAFFVVLMAIVPLLAACSREATEDTADKATLAAESADTVNGAVSGMATPSDVPPLPTSIATVDPMQRIAGTYQFRPTGEETADYFLVLNADGTAEIDEHPVGSADPNDLSVDAIGERKLHRRSHLGPRGPGRDDPGAVHQ